MKRKKYVATSTSDSRMRHKCSTVSWGMSHSAWNTEVIKQFLRYIRSTFATKRWKETKLPVGVVMHVVCPHVQSSQNTLAGEKFKRKARSMSLARLCVFVVYYQEVKFMEMKTRLPYYVVTVSQALLGAFTNLRKATTSFVMSVHMVQLGGFSWNLIFECFSKICQ